MARQQGPRPQRRPLVRYYDAANKQVKKGTPGARKVKEFSETYYLRDALTGRAWVNLETADEGQAWEKVRAIVKRHAGAALGIVPEQADLLTQPLARHFEEFERHVRDSGSGAAHARTLGQRLTLLAHFAGWKVLADLSPETLVAGLARLQKGGTDHRGLYKRGVSARTRNHFLTHAKEFVHWCLACRPRRLSENPFAGARPVPVEPDLRHERRAPSDEEMVRLYDYLHGPDARTLRGMSGPRRWMGYQVSMSAGLRANELRTLAREAFDLEAGTVTVRAGYSKHRRRDVVHLPGWLVEELRVYFAAGGGCWGTIPGHQPGRHTLKKDLARAGVAHESDGLFLDFHSLRHWFVTQVASQTDTSVKTALERCRLTSPALFLQTYAKVKVRSMERSAEQMPRPGRGTEKDAGSDTDAQSG